MRISQRGAQQAGASLRRLLLTGRSTNKKTRIGVRRGFQFAQQHLLDHDRLAGDGMIVPAVGARFHRHVGVPFE